MLKIKSYIPLFAAACCVALAACSGSGGKQYVSSTILPGNPIIAFPENFDKSNTTTIGSIPMAEQAGVSGTVLTISSRVGRRPIDQLTLDSNGNLGLRGSIAARGNIATVSTIKAKKDIHAYEHSALNILRHVRIVTYRYKGEPESVAPHIGFIAEDTPADLAGPAHNEFIVNNSVAVAMAADQQLDGEVRALQAQIAELKSELQMLKHQNAKERE